MSARMALLGRRAKNRAAPPAKGSKYLPKERFPIRSSRRGTSQRLPPGHFKNGSTRPTKHPPFQATFKSQIRFVVALNSTISPLNPSVVSLKFRQVLPGKDLLLGWVHDYFAQVVKSHNPLRSLFFRPTLPKCQQIFKEFPV